MEKRRARYLTLLAGLTCAAVVSALFLSRIQDEVGTARRALSRACARQWEPRLAGGFEHGPCESPRAARCQPPPTPGSPEFDRLVGAGNRVRQAVRGHRTAPSLHLEAVHSLLWANEAAQILPVLEGIEAAAVHAPGDAHVWNDLAAVHYVRALGQGSPWYLLTAMEAAAQAVELDPTLAAARFNLALILERLHLRHEARRAWRDYLELDADSGWAREARQHLAELEGATRQERWLERRSEAMEAARSGDPGKLEELARRFPMEMHLDLRDRVLPAKASWPVTAANSRRRTRSAG